MEDEKKEEIIEEVNEEVVTSEVSVPEDEIIKEVVGE